MKKIIDDKNILVGEIEESDIDKWIRDEFKESHPETLAKITFPKRVMDIISSDHHKSKDGSFQMSYDFWSDRWYFSHNGYIREVETEGKTFLEAAEKYIAAIRRENDKVLYRKIEEEANKHLPDNYSVEIGDDNITLYDYAKGYDNLKTIAFRDCKGKSVKEIIDLVNEMLNEEIC